MIDQDHNGKVDKAELELMLKSKNSYLNRSSFELFQWKVN